MDDVQTQSSSEEFQVFGDGQFQHFKSLPLQVRRHMFQLATSRFPQKIPCVVEKHVKCKKLKDLDNSR